MSASKPSAKAVRYAASQNETGLHYYAEWEIDRAVEAFREAAQADPDNPEYHLNLARSHARASNFQEAIRSLGDYLRTETNEDIAARYERLFSSALDEVETALIEKSQPLDLTVQHVGKAIQMWLEYRITLGRQELHIDRPEAWAAALAYAVGKVNFLEITRPEIARAFDVSEKALKRSYAELVQTLDLMPADFRYFTGEANPLDQLVEAAQMLEQLYDRFRDE